MRIMPRAKECRVTPRSRLVYDDMASRTIVLDSYRGMHGSRRREKASFNHSLAEPCAISARRRGSAKPL